MDFWHLAYNLAALPLARAGSRLAAVFRPKVARGLNGRKRSFTRIESYLSAYGHGIPATGGILFHATSVGEYLQALPLMRELKTANKERPLYLSFFSPSVEKRARACAHANLVFYLPEDTRANITRLLVLLKPTLIVISKFDIWPNLVTQAYQAGIPVAVIAATLSPDSGRLRGLSGRFHRSFYPGLSLVCAIAKDDAKNFIRLGVKEQNCILTGDTRFDQTWLRASEVAEGDPLVVAFSGWKNHFRFACGSIWPADQKHLLPALAELCNRHEHLRLILAPHEPTQEHVESLVSFLKDNNLSFELYSILTGSGDRGTTSPVSGNTRAVIVDTVGALAAVYRAADTVYVGGSFGRGVHNVMEPACFGLPVIFGPRHLNSHEALIMIERGGAFPVEKGADIVEIAGRLIENESFLRQAGRKARAIVTENLGATERTLEALSGKFPEVIGDLPG